MQVLHAACMYTAKFAQKTYQIQTSCFEIFNKTSMQCSDFHENFHANN